MANAQVNLSFLENGRRGLYSHVYIFYMLDTSFLFEQDTIHGPTAHYFMQFMFQQLFCCYDFE